MLQAMNTGHDGSLSTVHANSPRDALARIETMVLMAGYDLPVRAIRQQVASALDLIVHLERLAGRLAPGDRDHRGAAHGVRRDHAAGRSSSSRSRRSRPTARSSARCSRPGLRPTLPAQVREARGRAPERASSTRRTAPDERAARRPRDETARHDRGPGGAWRWRSPAAPAAAAARDGSASAGPRATPSPTAPSCSSLPTERRTRPGAT